MTPTIADTQGQQIISELVWPISGAGEADIDEDGLFGTYRIHEDKTMHEGIDIDAAKDTSVDAVKEGEIIFAGPQGAYGNLVIVKHADGTETYYAHLNSFSVLVGDQVQQGQSIGCVGNTAYGEWVESYMEDHLHFGYLVNGKPVDPLPYLLPGQ
ncbi:MAG: M23 family metallopeptidase [Coprothermobacterota bacterium]|nr:M23 family metallopeptidase [Coprothermobacterota bacterium]